MNKTKQALLAMVLLLLAVALVFFAKKTDNKDELKTEYRVPAPHPNPQFSSPLRIPLSLAANFCEIRKDHYHMGFDIRTEQKENIPVYAVEDGYISRIGISPTGYGNVIYIDHVNGYTSVYAHLNDFYPGLQSYVSRLQQEQERWELDVKLLPNQIPVKKGQFIAYSGNTGSSAGPHLHFEIRETESERAVNPMAVGFTISDNIIPLVYGVYYYDRTISTYRQEPKQLNYKGRNVHKVPAPLISLAAKAEDKNNSSSFMMGIYRAQIIKDGRDYFSATMNRFPYDQTRYVNAAIDYKKWAKDGSKIQHLSRLPGNRAELFDTAVNNGVLDLSDGAVHNIILRISDFSGNSRDIPLQLQYQPVIGKHVVESTEHMIIPNKALKISGAGAVVMFTEVSVYDTVPFQIQARPSKMMGAVSDEFYVGDTDYPLQDSVPVEIEPNRSIDEQKLVMLMQGSHNYWSVQKPVKVNSRYSARYNRFGKAVLIEDNIAPVITGFHSGRRVQNAIKLQATDNLKTIKTFRGEIDGKWVMFKRNGNIYTCIVDTTLTMETPHTLRVIAEDVAGNIREEQYTFERSNATTKPVGKHRKGTSKKTGHAKRRK